ncbi:MAG: alpha/beta hydrolase [Planctomycetota bacterium]
MSPTRFGNRPQYFYSALLCFCGLLIVGDLIAQDRSDQFTTSGRVSRKATNPLAAPQWVKPAVVAGRLQRMTFASKAAHAKVSYFIHLPADYVAEPHRRFPVMYWLHGLGSGPQGLPQIVKHFEGAMRAEKTPAMIVVFVNGLTESMWCDAKDGTMPVESVFVKELIPHVDSAYRTIPQREGRLIEGFSMGGFGAARLGFKHHELFGSVSMLAGALHSEASIARRRGSILKSVFGGDSKYFDAQSPWGIAEANAEFLGKQMLIRQVVGERDPTLACNRDFDAHLTRLKIPHEYDVLPEVRHDPVEIYESLGERNWEFYRCAFRECTASASDGP